MGRNAVHYWRYPNAGTLCGQGRYYVKTEARDEVTCKRCLRLLREEPAQKGEPDGG
jgi:hypothetical protein